MTVLIACEESGRVRDAFLAQGISAISCDILPSATPGPHIQGDLAPLLRYKWDMIIAFPPCLRLSSIGARNWSKWQATGEQQAAMRFVKQIAAAKCPRIAIENPVGYLNKNWRKPNQIFNPYEFGDPWQKRTCLWLKGLPLLEPTNVVVPLGKWVNGDKCNDHASGSYRPGQTKAERSRLRSQTFQGVADAMAEQWGDLA